MVSLRFLLLFFDETWMKIYLCKPSLMKSILLKGRLLNLREGRSTWETKVYETYLSRTCSNMPRCTFSKTYKEISFLFIGIHELFLQQAVNVISQFIRSIIKSFIPSPVSSCNATHKKAILSYVRGYFDIQNLSFDRAEVSEITRHILRKWSNKVLERLFLCMVMI